MKTLGILGGLGPESTMLYYREIIRGYQAAAGADSYPELVIRSVDMQAALGFLEKKDSEGFIGMLASGIESLRRAGCGLGLIASNTPHQYFEAIQARTTLPLLSIVEATVHAAKVAGLRQLLLLGTGFTMRSDFYAQAFAAAGMTVVVPEDRVDWIHEKIMQEIERGMIRDETRQGMIGIIEDQRQRRGIEGVILGCTELPLILSAEDLEVPVLDTTAIHVAAALEEMVRA